MKLSLIKSISFVLMTSIFILQISCTQTGKKQKVEVSVDANEDDLSVIEDMKRAKQIFYSLPSPLETAMLLKRAGAGFYMDILNPTESASSYTTNKSMALNMGIYSTDMSYCSLYDQTQETINYMSAARKMADGLGILNAIDENTIAVLEENINDRDIIMDVISETFLNSSSFLEENDREAIASLVLIGGWIEGLYIALSIEEQTSNEELVNRVIDQKLSIDNILRLLEDSKDNPSVMEVQQDINELKLIYDRITIKASKVEAVMSDDESSAVLKSSNKVRYKKETFEELRNKIKDIRDNYIQ